MPAKGRQFRLLVVEEQDRGGDGGGPGSALCADCGLRDVGSLNNLVGDAVYLLLLIPTLVGVKVDVEGGGEHLGGELFGVVAGLVFGLAEAVVLGEVAVGAFVSGYSDADAADDEAVGLAGGVFCDDGEDDLAGVEAFEPLLARDELAARRKD